MERSSSDFKVLDWVTSGKIMIIYVWTKRGIYGSFHNDVPVHTMIEKHINSFYVKLGFKKYMQMVYINK